MPGDEPDFDAMFRDLDDKPSDLVFFPRFSHSNHYESPRPLGALLGLSLESDQRKIFKAVVEGLVLEMKLHLDALGAHGARIDELRATGGGSRSRSWLQLKANIFGMPISTLRVEEAGCLAGAILAGGCTGAYRGVREAVSTLVTVRETVYPEDSFDSALYAEKEHVYGRLFDSFKKPLSGEKEK